MAVGLAGLVRWRSVAGVRIGLAVPGRPIGPWSRRTGAPEASATGRDRNPIRLWSVEPGVTRDHRGSSRTLIQQVMGRLASSTDRRSVAYNDEVTGSSPVTPHHGQVGIAVRGEAHRGVPGRAATS